MSIILLFDKTVPFETEFNLGSISINFDCKRNADTVMDELIERCLNSNGDTVVSEVAKFKFQ